MPLKRLKNNDFFHKFRFRPLRSNTLLSFFSALALLLFLSGDESHLALQRHALANEIRLTAIITGMQTGIYNIDKGVIRAMARVPRHRYVNWPYKGYAYYNIALPVDGHDYMIPAPFVTAMMIHLMDIDKDDDVLDIGFGPGYDAAVMAHLAHSVHSVTQIEPLEQQDHILSSLNKGYRNIATRQSGGTLGWPEAGPYDAILVRQSMRNVPYSLLNQLKPGGRLVIPIGTQNESATLTVFMRGPDGSLYKRPTIHMKAAPLLKGEEI